MGWIPASGRGKVRAVGGVWSRLNRLAGAEMIGERGTFTATGWEGAPVNCADEFPPLASKV